MCVPRADNNRIGTYNPLTGASLWSDTTIGLIHWQSPIVVNGVLYLEDGSGHVLAWVP